MGDAGSARAARLRELQQHWAAAFPKRAAGGTVSVAGFGYQFLAVLRDVVRAWLDAPTGVPPVAEALSDLAQPRADGKWTITQMKQTGTSGTLAKALEELWTIDVVARRSTPDFVDHLRYEVRCGAWTLHDVRASIDRWAPATKGEANEQTLQAFRERVFVSTDPHPKDDLVALLANNLSAADPLGWTHEWMGRLMSAAAEPGGPETLSVEIYSALTALRNAETARRMPDGVRLIPPDLSEPATTTRGPHLVGEQPTLRHLRDGWLAPRRWQVVPAAKAFHQWAETDPFGADKMRRLPVFWITGRSGCGKSTLLLQVLAHLASSGAAPVVWLGGRTRLLADAMKWARSAIEHGAQPLVCIDDPYSSGDQDAAATEWRRALACLEIVRDEGDVAPIVVACGPIEQVEAIERDFGDDILVYRWHLDETLDEANLETLQAWFGARTGRSTPDTGQGDILMVQRFFEWQTGEPLPSFASRFRKRVERLDRSGRLAPFFANLLAVNRLYAGLPPRASLELRDDDRDALEFLKRDHHIDIDATEGRPGIWLTHPHLADALFRGWFSDSEPNQRSGALREAILLSKDRGSTPGEQTAPLWAIVRALAADDLLAARVDRETVTPMLEEAHSDWTAGSPSMPFAHLPVWLRLCQALPGLELTPKPLDQALGQMDPARVEETGFRLTCHTLLSECARLGPDKTATVLTAIRKALDGAHEWYEWPHVGIDLAQRTAEHQDGQRLIRWASQRRASRQVPRVLATALAIPATTKSARQLALTQADDAPCDPAWAALYETLLDTGDETPSSLVAWARRHQTAPRVTFVLLALLLRKHPDAASLARSWLAENVSSPVANFLIEQLKERDDAGEFERSAAMEWIRPSYVGADRLIEWLLEERQEPGELIVIAEEWLGRHPERAGWAFLLQKLIDVVHEGEQRQDLINRGVAWLEGREEDQEWAHVLQKLIDVVRDEHQRQNLIGRGIDWLEGREERREWNYVLQKLIDEVREDQQRQELVERGIEWLEGREEREEWTHVLQKLIDVVREDQQWQDLVERGIEWLEGREDRKAWTHVLRKLVAVVRDEHQRQNLVERGIEWLEGREEDQEWAHVLQKLIDVAPDEHHWQNLVERGIEWLEGREERKEWNYVLQKLIDEVREDQQQQKLIERGIEWLEGREERKAWTHVLRKLIDVVREDQQRQQLVERGIEWLEGREEDPEWAHALQKLIDEVREDQQRQKLVERGIEWLEGREERREWAHVLQKLIDEVREDQQLRKLVERGIEWLEGREERNEWNYVLQKLIDEVREDQQRQKLVERGIEWLEGREERKEWAHVLQKLVAVVRDEHQRQRLVERGIEWLEGREERKEWNYVLQKLIDVVRVAPQRQQLVERGIEWLDGREEDQEWTHVLQKLIDVVPDEHQWQNLVERGIEWLEGREERREWNYVLQKLIDVVRVAPRRQELIEKGIEWLDGREERPEWIHILRKLIATVDEAERPALVQRGLDWTNARASRHRWVDTLRRMLPSSETRSSLAELTGCVVPARVTGIADFGVFFDVQGYPGLLHESKFRGTPNADLVRQLAVDENRPVRVLSADLERQRLELALPDYQTAEDLAREAIAEALATGQSVDLPPMPSYERRLAHEAVEAHPDVRSRSTGQGAERHVVVLPATLD